MTNNKEYQCFFLKIQRKIFLYLTNQQHTINTGTCNFYKYYFFAIAKIICCWYSPILAECFTKDF